MKRTRSSRALQSFCSPLKVSAFIYRWSQKVSESSEEGSSAGGILRKLSKQPSDTSSSCAPATPVNGAEKPHVTFSTDTKPKVAFREYKNLNQTLGMQKRAKQSKRLLCIIIY